MEWLEAKTLPKECRKCRHGDCYNCDYAGKRWYLSPEDEERVRQSLLKKAQERIQRKLKETHLP